MQPAQQIKRTFRAFLRSYLPSPQTPMSPLLIQEIQPVVELDNLKHLGPQVQMLRQWNSQLVAAPGPGRHASIMLLPGQDGLWGECIETAFAATLDVHYVTSGSLDNPVGWTAGLVPTALVHSYNPANPQSRPVPTGFATDPAFGGHINSGDITTAGIPADNVAYTLAVGETLPRQGQPPWYIPPDNSLILSNSTANALLLLNVMVADPTFRTGANI